VRLNSTFGDKEFGVMTNNPWLEIPLDDYEGHMALPYVGQARLLSDIFGNVLDQYAPHSVALLGCAGGNGFEQAAARSVDRVVGIDINPDYIEHARARWHAEISTLDLIVGNLQEDEFHFAPVELVFSGLLFEYVNVSAVLGKVRSMLLPRGTLVAVTQLPSAATAEITPSPFNSLNALSRVMHLVEPRQLRELAENLGYREAEAYVVNAESSKRFSVQSFSRSAEHPSNRSRFP
jgi:ubiquinone/menaquinone biosynthesis C-methylase UbiE